MYRSIQVLWTLEINIDLSLKASVNIVFKVHKNLYWPLQKTIIVYYYDLNVFCHHFQGLCGLCCCGLCVLTGCSLCNLTGCSLCVLTGCSLCVLTGSLCTGWIFNVLTGCCLCVLTGCSLCDLTGCSLCVLTGCSLCFNWLFFVHWLKF